MGMGIGAAMTGLRVVIEGMNMGFLLLAYNQISNNAGMLHYTSGGQYKARPRARRRACERGPGWAPASEALQPGGRRARPARPSQSRSAAAAAAHGLRAVLGLCMPAASLLPARPAPPAACRLPYRPAAALSLAYPSPLCLQRVREGKARHLPAAWPMRRAARRCQ